jgi:hypothetical protein
MILKAPSARGVCLPQSRHDMLLPTAFVLKGVPDVFAL